MTSKPIASGSPAEQSLSRDEALARGLLIAAPGARIASSVRVVPTEDNGAEFGPVRVGERTIIRDCVILSTGVTIGADVLIGHHCVLRRRVQVGSHSVLSHLVSVQHDVVIGERVRVSSLTHLTGGSVLEDDVEIGAGVATVDDNAMEWPKSTLLRAAVFRKGCRVGSGSTVLGSVEIGSNTLVGAGSVVTRSLPANVVAFGNPAYIQRERPAGS